MNLLLNLWNTLWEQLGKVGPDLVSLWQKWADDVWSAFPLGWLRDSPGPGRIWITQRSLDVISDSFNVVENVITTLPALVAANVVLTAFTIDPKLRQRVMTLDQVALFPIRVIIDLGINAATNPIRGERELRITERVLHWQKLFDLINAEKGILKKLFKYLFGSVWGRILRLIIALAKVAQAMTYVLILYRYLQTLDDIGTADELWFNAKLTNEHPRKSELVRIRRRVGGVPP